MTAFQAEKIDHAKIVGDYYHSCGVQVQGPLKEHISRRNDLVLRYISYVINNLLSVSGVQAKLTEIARIHTQGNEAKREFKNTLVEFHGCYFVECQLQHKVVEIEARSPRRIGEKRCDIGAQGPNGELYFEVKDASSEILSEYLDSKDSGLTHFAPDGAEGAARWFLAKANDANEKGADYLIAHISESVFADTNDLNRSLRAHSLLETHQPAITLTTTRTLRGIYVIRPDDYFYYQVI